MKPDDGPHPASGKCRCRTRRLPEVLVEVRSGATPTDGTAMRWDASNQQYIFNLSTKPLSYGGWKVRIGDGTFAAPVEADFSIKKESGGAACDPLAATG